MVRPDKAPEYTEGGLTIPTSAQKKICTGTIVRAPDGQSELEGRPCIYKPDTGVSLEVKGENVLFINTEEELLAIDLPEDVETEDC